MYINIYIYTHNHLPERELEDAVALEVGGVDQAHHPMCVYIYIYIYIMLSWYSIM